MQKYVYDALYHGDTLMCQIWYDFVKRNESCGPNTKPWLTKPCKFDMEVKRSTLYWDHGDWSMCQIWYASVMANRRYGSDMIEDMSKPFKFDIEVKGQHSIGIMNVRETLSQSDTRKLWYKWANYGMPMRERNLYRQTHRPIKQTEIPLYPLL